MLAVFKSFENFLENIFIFVWSFHRHIIKGDMCNLFMY